MTAFWIGFSVLILAMLALDLGVFRRKEHDISFKEALTWTIVWIALALAFNAAIYFWKGPKPAIEFLTGYLIEESLSIDNLFVFLLIFTAFKIPSRYQHTVLFWGIIGAFVMRGVFIISGVTLLNTFHWISYIFGAFLVYTGFKVGFQHDEEYDPEKSKILAISRKLLPVAKNDVDGKFFVRENGKLLVTPLFIIVILVNVTDLVFAVDSIPAILAVTKDPFILYTSNVFAILGLRSLFFVIGAMVDKFYYLRYCLAVILSFVGGKMLLAGTYDISITVSLLVVLGVFAISVLASIWRIRKQAAALASIDHK